jgi:hypothetical protein
MDFQKILTKQEEYRKKRGKYFQVLKGGKKPKSRNDAEEYKDVDYTDIPPDIEIHTHEGTDEIGFTVVERKTELGKDYVKQTGHGIGRTKDWQEVIKI